MVSRKVVACFLGLSSLASTGAWAPRSCSPPTARLGFTRTPHTRLQPRAEGYCCGPPWLRGLAQLQLHGLRTHGAPPANLAKWRLNGKAEGRTEEGSRSAIPVTLISGLDEIGKEELLRRILAGRDGKRVAILTNDVGRVIDEEGSRSRPEWETEAIQEAVELRGGSRCCQAADGMLEEAVTEVLGWRDRMKSLVITTSPTDDPLSVAEDLVELSPLLRVDTLVTVVDAPAFLSEWTNADLLVDRGLEDDDDDARTVADVLASQVEYADVIVLRCSGPWEEAEHGRVESLLRLLNPRAKVLLSRAGACADIAVQDLVETGAFDLDEIQRPGWLRLLSGEGEAKQGGKQGGVRAVVFRARRPFHPARLWSFIHSEMGGVLRSRGFFWLGSRRDLMGVWNQAGMASAAENGGPWWAATDRELWPDGPGDIESILADFDADPEVGDRRQELVLFGGEEEAARWEGQLQECLLREGEGTQGLEDPFPVWEMEDEDHEHDHDHDDDHHHHHDHHHHEHQSEHQSDHQGDHSNSHQHDHQHSHQDAVQADHHHSHQHDHQDAYQHDPQDDHHHSHQNDYYDDYSHSHQSDYVDDYFHHH